VNPQLDLTAPIVPARGLGGFHVGRPLVEYEHLLRLDREAVTPRVHGLWQVVFRLDQIYVPTLAEDIGSHWRFRQFSRSRRRGDDADFGDVLAVYDRPETVPAIDLFVDVRDGIIDAVVALPGYHGTLRAVRPGMTFGEVEAVEPRLNVPFFLDETTIDGVEGVGLWLDPPDPDPDRRAQVPLEGIAVFDPARTRDGIKPY
jgi:hypothetical protein